jgi:hypothetical protein
MARDHLACIAELALLTIMLAGCSALSGYPTNYQNTDAVLAADAPYLSADVRTNATVPNDSARGGLSQQQYRDTVVYRRIEVIDINYYDFESKMVGSYDALALGTDLTALILNGFGATTGGAATKAALAAASGGVIGANAAVNTDVFYKKTLPALVSQMRASRQTDLVTIERGLTNPVSKYPLDQALADVNSYYIAGTLPSAVAQVTSKAVRSRTRQTLNSPPCAASSIRRPLQVRPRSRSWPGFTPLMAIRIARWSRAIFRNSQTGQTRIRLTQRSATPPGRIGSMLPTPQARTHASGLSNN